MTFLPDEIAFWTLPFTLLLACAGGTSSQRPVRVVLTPASANVFAGRAQKFTAHGQWSDGAARRLQVTYAAEGGVITPAGEFTAGVDPGTYRVVATQREGTLADTALVAILPIEAHSYMTDFPLSENPLSEGGRWINGGTVGLDWTNISTTPGLAIGHQCCASYTDATAILTGTWGPDQQATATVYSVNQNDACYEEVELRLRSVISAHRSTGYEISFKASQTGAAYLIIVRWNGPLGDFTYLSRKDGAQYGVKTGDVVSASVVGNVITAYRNGVQVGRATDDTYAGGAPGLGFNLESARTGCPGANGNYGVTSFSATDSL
jgi:hypothetical protein